MLATFDLRRLFERNIEWYSCVYTLNDLSHALVFSTIRSVNKINYLLFIHWLLISGSTRLISYLHNTSAPFKRVINIMWKNKNKS